jgi:nucleoside-diphosphate-sugar epimerase
MSDTVIVAGATGRLGTKIVDALVERGAVVQALAREETGEEKIKALREKGVRVFLVNMGDKEEIAEVCAGAVCVVSALAGPREVVIDVQKSLLDGAVEAGVPRFIASDYSLDFTGLVPGTNRNLDLRREFHAYLDQTPIAATTIFNGAFMELLTTDMPLIIYRFRRILYWGDPSVKMDFTTMDDAAEFTARAALDVKTPRFLRVAGDRVSARDIRDIMTDITGKNFRIFRAGSIGLLNIIIKIARFFFPAKNNLYPAWQGMQYMRDMKEGRAALVELDKDRYPGLAWTSVKEYLKSQNVRKFV